ncbi:metallophosphoesterase [candidate division KSB1 bacterium]|nr:metallophosphoesterase [candidate division KSB1 bacterium]
MNLLHFSDTHLGYSEYSKIDPTTGINQREQDFYDAWQQVINAVFRLKPDVVLHTGDLFHTPRPSNRAIRVALESIQKISDAGIPIVIISGNHETPRIKATGSIFESISLFTNVYAAFDSKYERFRIGDCDFHCVPHCSLTEELEKAFQSVRILKDASKNVFLTHGAWTGRQYFGMGEFNEQRLPDIEKELGFKFDYIALGHYHKKLDVKNNATYCGSTERTSLNEHGNSTGFLMVDLETGSKNYFQIKSRPMIKLPVVDCKGKTARNIYDELHNLATPALDQAIVYLILEHIEENTFLKIDIRELDHIFSSVFYLQKSLIRETGERNQIVSNSKIESLAVEFERYLATVNENEINRDKLRDMGLSYLTRFEI